MQQRMLKNLYFIHINLSVMTQSIVERLTLKTRIGYGIGDIAICLYWSGVGLYLLYFYTDVVGISPLLAGWIYALGIAWDAITDPFMGYIAERTRTKMGSYRPYIFYGSIPLALSFILLLWVPPFEGSLLFIFLLAVNLVHRTCFTIVSVPYSSLTARITDDSDERTKLTTARMLAASFGTLTVSAFGFPIVLWFGGGEEALGFVLTFEQALLIGLLHLLFCLLDKSWLGPVGSVWVIGGVVAEKWLVSILFHE